MKKETAKHIRLIYSVVLGIAAVAAGICLMAACLDIYRSGGDQIYTPQKVAQAFAPIAPVVYFTLTLVIGGFLLDLALPANSKKVKADKNPAVTLDRLLSKRDVENCDPATRQAMVKLQKGRMLRLWIGAALLVVCSVVFLSYGANPANFHQSQINASMVNAMWVLLPCLAVPFAFAVYTAYYTKASLQKEIELVKTIPAGEKKEPVPAKKTPANGLLIARFVLVCAGIALLIYGFLAGGTADVLTKAVNICTECVGLG